MKYKYYFAMGDCRGIREIMLKHAPWLKLKVLPWQQFGYPADEGDASLLESIAKLTKDLTGYLHKYTLITNGATHAINAFIYARRTEITTEVITHPLYFFFYPQLIRCHGLSHVTNENLDCKPHQIALLDSPSNPAGDISGDLDPTGKLWDMAYYSPTYCGVGVADGTLRCAPTKPAHEAVAGSLSKLTGINGIRIGWLSTDSLSLYHKAREYVASTSCGISYPSQFIADQILRKVNLDDFYKESNDLLNCNKEQLNKLGCILGHQPIPKFGMFALFEIDDKLEALLQKASVKVMPGNLCGDVNRHSIRINLANSRELTKLMVNTIIRLDKK